jgi:hypothetical protein
VAGGGRGVWGLVGGGGMGGGGGGVGGARATFFPAQRGKMSTTRVKNKKNVVYLTKLIKTARGLLVDSQLRS